jgi:hypothetical protein
MNTSVFAQNSRVSRLAQTLKAALEGVSKIVNEVC